MKNYKYYKIETICKLKGTYKRIPIRFLLQGENEEDALNKFCRNDYLKGKFDQVEYDIIEITKDEYNHLAYPNQGLNDASKFENNNKS